ncbi:MAG TPA: BLUF domain-containing protein [Flavobacteriaceae bacterium]|nr:BLUF domain-containing protein [Flavobacteriaceae bacterium]
MLKYLAYVSRQSFILSNDDISQLLETCRTNNSNANITGMLIYFDGTFVQFIEGPENNIDQLFQKIKKDKRHQDVVLLIDGIQVEREFSNWYMAYKELTLEETAKRSGQKQFRKEDLFKGKDPNTSHSGLILIKSFVNNLHI